MSAPHHFKLGSCRPVADVTRHELGRCRNEDTVVAGESERTICQKSRYATDTWGNEVITETTHEDG